MGAVDDGSKPHEANADGGADKMLKRIASTKARLLPLLVVLSIALLAVALWRATTVPAPQLNRPLLWKIKQLLPWFRETPASTGGGCGANLSGLCKALRAYADDSEGRYPAPNRWCDLLVDLDFTTPKQFLCTDALRAGDRGPCHFAINPNATPDSDPNVVLIFETKAGWNQFGGPEILATRTHEGRGEGCIIVFADGKVRFIQPKDLSKLKWK